MFLASNWLDNRVDKTLKQYHKDHLQVFYFLVLFLCFFRFFFFFLFVCFQALFFQLLFNYWHKMATIPHVSCLPAIVSQMSFK